MNNKNARGGFAVSMALFLSLSGCATTVSPLFRIIEEGSDTKLQEYIKGGGSIHERNFSGVAPIHLASGNGNLDIVDTLVKAGADVNIRAFGGDTPYTIAVRNNHADLIDYFQARDIELETNYSNFNIVFIAAVAAVNGNPKVMEYIKQRGVDLNVKNAFNENALHMASSKGYLEIVEFLIANGVNASAQAQNQMTPLHYAAISGNFDIVDALIIHGVKPSLATSNAQSNHATGLLYEYLAIQDRRKGNTYNAKENFKIAAQHYWVAGGVYLFLADKINTRIDSGNSNNFDNIGQFLFRLIIPTPGYQPNLNNSDNSRASELALIKLATDMITLKDRCLANAESL